MELSSLDDMLSKRSRVDPEDIQKNLKDLEERTRSDEPGESGVVNSEDRI